MPSKDLMEWVSDQLLLLYVLKIASQKKPLVITRIQKIIFLAELESWKKKVGGLDYAFIKFNHEPYSSEIKGDIRRLKKREFIRCIWPNRAHFLLPDGEKFLQQVMPILERNKDILDVIEEVAEIIMKPKFEEMLSDVYSRPNPLYPTMTIEETPEKKYLLSRETRPRDIVSFKISEAEAESLEVVLDPQLWKKHILAEESVRNEPSISWRKSPLFSD